MSQVYLKSVYDFYSLPDVTKLGLLGTPIKDIAYPTADYFPIRLTEDCFNYGQVFGLIHISGVAPYFRNTRTKCFSIGVTSPDDLDLAVDYSGYKMKKLRVKIYNFLCNKVYVDTPYKQVLEDVIKHVGHGEIQ